MVTLAAILAVMVVDESITPPEPPFLRHDSKFESIVKSAFEVLELLSGVLLKLLSEELEESVVVVVDVLLLVVLISELLVSDVELLSSDVSSTETPEAVIVAHDSLEYSLFPEKLKANIL